MKNFALILLVYFLKYCVFIYAGQVIPQHIGIQKILTAIQKKDLKVLQSMIHPEYFNFTFYESQKYWTPSAGSFHDSEVAKLLTDSKFLKKKYAAQPPEAYEGPKISLSETLQGDFYAEANYLKNRYETIDGRSYFETEVILYYNDFEYTLFMYCNLESVCLLSEVLIRGGPTTSGSTARKWEKACETSKDMYGKPMKKTMCPDH